MKRITTVMLSAAVVVAMTAGLVAQAKPNFAGKWTLDAPAAPAAPPQGGAPGGAPGGGGRGGGRGGGWGQEATITQDATTLTIDYTQGQNPVKLAYKLDGTESKNTMMGRGGATEQVSKATWDGAKLKIVTTTPNGEQTRLVSLEGGKLTIETTQPGMDGAAMTNKVTYTKAP
jgi:hypothetical protein